MAEPIVSGSDSPPTREEIVEKIRNEEGIIRIKDVFAATCAKEREDLEAHFEEGDTDPFIVYRAKLREGHQKIEVADKETLKTMHEEERRSLSDYIQDFLDGYADVILKAGKHVGPEFLEAKIYAAAFAWTHPQTHHSDFFENFTADLQKKGVQDPANTSRYIGYLGQFVVYIQDQVKQRIDINDLVHFPASPENK